MARKAAALVLPALFAAGLLVSNAAPATSPTCPHTQTPATEISMSEFEDSVFCPINLRRAEHGLRRLRPDGLLRKAAAGYARSMLAGRFFSHHGELAGHDDSSTVIGRLRQVGYIRPGSAWIVGENLRWSCYETNSAAAIVTAWMKSAEHRIYLLKPRFEELGVAAVRGYPADPADPSTVTVTSEFGFRRD